MFKQVGKNYSETMTARVSVHDYASSVIDDQTKPYGISRPTVSVIIPTLNEAQNLPLVIPYLPMNWIDEVILVDGHSIDNSIEIAQQLLPSIVIVEEKVKGKGSALRAGYQAARGDILIVIDADGSHDPREIPRFVTALMEGADFVKGSRFAPGGGTTDMPRVRKFGNSTFVFLANVLFDVKFTDLCYGFHAFWRYCLDAIDLQKVDGFEIDTSLYLKAVRARMRLVEVPSFEGYRFYGVGKLQTIPDGTRVLRTIISEWFDYLRGEKKESTYLGFRGSAYLNAGARSTSLVAANENLQYLKMLSLLAVGRANKQDMLDQLLQVSLQELRATSGSVILLDENGDFREGCSAYNGKTFPINSWPELIRQGLVGWVFKHREAALVPNTREDPRWLRRPWDESGECLRSALSVPLMVNDRVVGVITLVRAQAEFTANDLAVLSENTVCVK